MKPSRDIARLIEIMAALRTPGTGCPWDLEQDFASVAPYTVEEAYEVADAIARGDKLDLKDELGDLLLQVVFHARMAEEEGAFAFPDVVEAITGKLIRRHPHVFGDARDLSPAEVKALWHRIKAQEKADKAAARAAADLPPQEEERGVLAGVPPSLPALTRAWKLQARASTVGFDWNDARLVLDKIREETQEIDEALADGDKAAIREEIGDLLFVIANLARHVDADPEGCLAAANTKFERRFKSIEAALEMQGRTAADASLEEMEALWQAVKKAEKAADS
ncbi:MAG: nucleoside triphosphate pyrophosphohydrolase [Bosea sp.]|uniref:nucleoside triphosphate pyrophosphohydrolase n=1 Tax=unclassified Bosea (in: a-proteobacteria) TaxID=2653178 RepID=UPI00096324C1|nr:MULTISPECIES: nucleoside triphosphate pyrophosphohydrolase [unclassified Bosea (in: a-proteobacteria)]MBN9457505.1 nucleoside triphosphate pyrophosphohydrolase [Bosea sp. (in: a-proteobacteria)]OJV09532.1 MAG: nucleoside triphosphate pyrophosphohydrolase [Bosea sp. 67-29]